MLKLRKLATVVLVGLVIFAWSLPVNDVHSLSTTPVSSGLILDGGFDVVPDGAGNFYILSYSDDNKTALALFDTSRKGITKQSFLGISSGNLETLERLEYRYSVVNFVSDVLYLFYMSEGSHYASSYKYSSSYSGWNTSSQLDMSVAATPQNVAVGSNGDIFIFTSNSSSADVYNDSGKVEGTKLTATDGPIAAITTDISKTYLYVATNDKLYRYKIGDTNYTFADVFIPHGVAPFKFLTDSLFITSAGKIYSLEKTWEKSDVPPSMQVTMADYDKGVAIAGFDNASILAKTAEKVVSRISCSDGAVSGKIEFSEKILAVATSGEKTIVVTGDATATNIHLITANDITEITPPEPEKPPEIGGGTTPETPNPDTPSEPPADTTVESTEGYEIGENVISKIPAGTTWGPLRNGLEANYITVELNGKSNATTSTKVATGHKVTFIFDNERKVTKTFTLIVEGDVTGSGNISSKSISALANHLLGKTELEGVYKDAANLSGDGDLSTVDLLLMYKQTQK